jgi:cold shock CspA family protein
MSASGRPPEARPSLVIRTQCPRGEKASKERDRGWNGWNGDVVQPGAEAGPIAVDEGQDVFVHFRAVQDSGLSDLKPGQRVEFDAQEAREGHRRRAVHLRPSTLCTCDRRRWVAATARVR